MREDYLPANLIVEEVADAFASMSHDPAAGLTTLRRVLHRQAGCGPLWWLGARALTATDVRTECRSVVDDIYTDSTVEELERSLPEGARVFVGGWPEQSALAFVNRPDVEVSVVDLESEGDITARQLAAHGASVVEVVASHQLDRALQDADVVVVESALAGSRSFVAVNGSSELCATAQRRDVAPWLVAGRGRRVPAWLFGPAADMVTGTMGGRTFERVAADHVAKLVCETGVFRCPPILATPGFPRTPELLVDPDRPS